MGGQKTSRYPSTLFVNLASCCKKTLADIREKKEIGRVLQGLLAVSPFLRLLGERPPETALHLIDTDWDIWEEAVHAVPVIVRERCRTLAGLELLSHPGGDLNRFWEAMYESFK